MPHGRLPAPHQLQRHPRVHLSDRPLNDPQHLIRPTYSSPRHQSLRFPQQVERLRQARPRIQQPRRRRQHRARRHQPHILKFFRILSLQSLQTYPYHRFVLPGLVQKDEDARNDVRHVPRQRFVDTLQPQTLVVLPAKHRGSKRFHRRIQHGLSGRNGPLAESKVRRRARHETLVGLEDGILRGTARDVEKGVEIQRHTQLRRRVPTQTAQEAPHRVRGHRNRRPPPRDHGSSQTPRAPPPPTGRGPPHP